MNAAVGLMDGLGLDGDWCIRVIPRQKGAAIIPDEIPSVGRDFVGRNLKLVEP